MERLHLILTSFSHLPDLPGHFFVRIMILACSSHCSWHTACYAFAQPPRSWHQLRQVPTIRAYHLNVPQGDGPTSPSAFSKATMERVRQRLPPDSIVCKFSLVVKTGILAGFHGTPSHTKVPFLIPFPKDQQKLPHALLVLRIFTDSFRRLLEGGN